jgi:hypothetical protein
MSKPDENNAIERYFASERPQRMVPASVRHPEAPVDSSYAGQLLHEIEIKLTAAMQNHDDAGQPLLTTGNSERILVLRGLQWLVERQKITEASLEAARKEIAALKAIVG